MNLIIDTGNTSTKLALFEGGKKLSVSRINELTRKELDKILDVKPEKVIISSVRELPAFISEMLVQRAGKVHVLNHRSALPFAISYKTPETLGSDRIAAVAGAYRLFPGSDILIIDAGTAITYEFMFGQEYAGGNISPGINLRFKALNEFTAKLPMVTPTDYRYTSPGQSTTDAIVAGVIVGVSYEINEYIRTFLEKNSEGKVVLTGGDGSLLNEKTDHEVIFEPDLVIDGLNYILEYNAK